MELESILRNIEEEEPEVVTEKCTSIAGGIQAGEYSIITLIEQLGSFLTSPIPVKREFGVFVFTEVLKQLPRNFLNVQQAEIIFYFYTGKLKDHHQVVPAAIKGILAILEFDRFPRQHVPIMLMSLFQNVACQQQKQADRYNIYLILKILLERYKKEMISMGIDLVYGVLTVIDGERDPRNLLFVFQWMETFVKTVPLFHLAEEVFEAVACYFPVDFKAPSNNSQITREDLARALCPLLCAIPEFGSFCIPLACQKLDSSLEIAKSDSLKLLLTGCETFQAASYMIFSSVIWTQLEKELFATYAVASKLRYLRTMSRIVKKLSGAVMFKSFLKETVDSLKGNLLPISKRFPVAANILVHMALGCKESSEYIMREVGPILINTFTITSTPSPKVAVLRCLIGLGTSYINYHPEEFNCTGNADIPNKVVDHEEVFNESVDDEEVLSNSIDNDKVSNKSVDIEEVSNKSINSDEISKSVDCEEESNKFIDYKGASNKSVDYEDVSNKSVDNEEVCSKMLDDEELPNKLAGEVCDIFSICVELTLNLDTDLQRESFNILSGIACSIPNHIRMTVYHNMQSLLVQPAILDIRIAIVKCFVSLAIYHPQEVRTQIIDKMVITDPLSLDLYLSALGFLVALDPFRDITADALLKYVNGNVEWSCIAIKIIRNVLVKNKNNTEVFQLFFEKNAINKLIEFAVYRFGDKLNLSVFFDISSILIFLIGSQDSTNQKQFTNLIDKIVHCVQNSDYYVLLLSGLISKLHQDIEIDYTLLATLVQVASSSTDEALTNETIQLLANVINKKSDDDFLITFLNNTKNKCLELLKINEHKCMLLLCWISKALVMKNHPLGYTWIDLLLELQKNCLHFSEGFRIILDDSYTSMSIDYHCKKKLLYRQKVFAYIINKLMECFSANDMTQLVLFSCLLESVPEQVILVHFKMLSRMLLLSLEKAEDTNTVLVLLKTIGRLLQTQNEVIEKQLESYILRILKFTTCDGSMRVRIEAIRCINQLSFGYPVYKLLPFKTRVLNQLSLCIDDRKRLVRKNAMEARSMWCLLDAPK